MEIRYTTISKTGRRHNNEDAFNVIDMPESNRFMGIVCDGMGGHSFGETASEWYAILYLTFGRSISVCPIATQR